MIPDDAHVWESNGVLYINRSAYEFQFKHDAIKRTMMEHYVSSGSAVVVDE